MFPSFPLSLDCCLLSIFPEILILRLHFSDQVCMRVPRLTTEICNLPWTLNNLSRLRRQPLHFCRRQRWSKFCIIFPSTCICHFRDTHVEHFPWRPPAQQSSSSGMLVSGRPDALCNALQAAPSSVGTIAKVLSNLVGQPADPKYRKLRLANKRIQETVVDVDGGVELLQVAHFCCV